MRAEPVGLVIAAIRFSAAAPGPLNAKTRPPKAENTKTASKIVMTVISGSSWLRGVQRIRQFVVEPEIARAVPKCRARDSGADMAPFYASGFVLAFDLKHQEVLGDDDVAFAADDFGDVRDAARTVAKAFRLNDDVDRTDDHFADRLRGQVVAAHGDQRLDTGEALAGRVGVDRAHRPVMARVHGLQQVERLGTTHFAHDDAFRPHTQTVAYEVAHRDLAVSLEIGRARLEA